MRKSFGNKKGLSAVVSNMIIILLVVVAVVSIWAVVRNFIDEGTSGLKGEISCADMQVQAMNPSCESGNCEVTLKRSAKGEEIAGVKVVFANSEENYVHTEPGNIPKLGTKFINVKTELENISSIKVYIQVKDASGKTSLCKGGFETKIK